MQNKKRLTLGSLFDGSGGFPLGGVLAGIEPVWASEIEPFPIRVTTKRIPNMKHYGDISTINGAEVEPVDIITFGSPCQDMSIAGRRAGLDGSRSSLFYEAIRVITEMREATNGEKPRFIVWENVPGAFSSNKGEDFRCVIESICRVKDPSASVPMSKKWEHAGRVLGDDYSVAWRVLDAQYWGVPQRRKRIFLVADFRGGSAPRILFESEGLSRYSPKGFASWQNPTVGASRGSGKASWGIDGYNAAVTGNKSSTLGANCGMSSGRNGLDETVPLETHPQDSRIGIAKSNIAQTLPGNMGQSPTTNVPLVLKVRQGKEGGDKGALIQINKSATLACSQDQTLFTTVAFSQNQREEVRELGSVSGALSANKGTHQQTYVVVDTESKPPQKDTSVVSVQGSMIGRSDKNGPQGSGIDEKVSFTLNATDRHAVCYGIARECIHGAINTPMSFTISPEIAPLIASGCGAVYQPDTNQCACKQP